MSGAISEMSQGASGVRQKSNNDWLVGQRVDRYDILHRLAAGGMGAVYVARAVGMGGFERLVAIKALHPHLAEEEEFISMLLDEARLAARMRHPNVVATLDVSQWEDLHYLVMEYVEGDHLAGLLKRPALVGERMAERPAVRIILDALAGLAHAHELTDDRGNSLNFVHRDVSPQNILVGADGIARLTDFGVAKAEYRLSSTRQGTFKGKLSYTAPETASTAHAEQRSDLFAMGVVLWEALTTSRLFKAENNVATLKKLLEEPIPLPSSVHEDLAPFDAVLAKALARPLDERFQTAGEMIEALERAAQQHQGIGSTREVAELVRREAKDKLAAEAAATRAAIALLEHGPPKAYSTGRHDAMGPGGPESQPPTVTSVPIKTAERKRRMVWLSIAAAVLVAAGVAVALSWGREPTAGAGSGGDGSRSPSEHERPGVENPETGMASGSEHHADEGTNGQTTNGTMVGATSDGDGSETGNDAAHTEPSETESNGTAHHGETKIRRGTGMRRPSMMSGDSDDDDVLSNPYREQ